MDWQAISAVAAFDGEITGATLEEMAGPVLIAPNTLQWTGQTTITSDITASTETVYTRFTVAADTVFSGPPPYVADVFLAGGLMQGQAALMNELDRARADIEALAAQFSASQEVDVTAFKAPKVSTKNMHVLVVQTRVNGVQVDAVVTSVTAVTESEDAGIGVEYTVGDDTLHGSVLMSDWN